MGTNLSAALSRIDSARNSLSQIEGYKREGNKEQAKMHLNLALSWLKEAESFIKKLNKELK